MTITDSQRQVGVITFGSPTSTSGDKKFTKGVKSSTGRIELTQDFIDQKVDSMREDLMESHRREKEAAIDPRSKEYIRDVNDLFPKNGKSSKTLRVINDARKASF